MSSYCVRVWCSFQRAQQKKSFIVFRMVTRLLQCERKHSHCVVFARLHFEIQSMPTDSIRRLSLCPIIRFRRFSIGLPTVISHLTTKLSSSFFSSCTFTRMSPAQHTRNHWSSILVKLFVFLLGFVSRVRHTVFHHFHFQSFHLIHFIWSAFITLLLTFVH